MRLVEISRTLAIQQPFGRQPHLLPRESPPRNPLQHPLHIAIHHGHRLAECNAGNGRGRISPYTGQILPSLRRLGKLPVPLPHHNLRRRMQHARPPVISQPAPSRQHRSFPRARQLLHRRKSPQKFVIMHNHCRHARLLQHDLRHPHPVRIMVLAPRQVARMRVIPRQQLRAKQ